MELDVTHMMEDSDDMPTLSGSVAELGTDAGKITWRNSLAYGAKHPLLSDDSARQAARDYFADFGAWDRDEIAAWTDAELEGLVSQYIAGSIRELQACESDADYFKNGDGRLFKGDDGRWYFYLGS